MERTIARLDAIGDKREADLWRNELAKLRDTLEKQHPPVRVKSRGLSIIIVAPDSA